MGCGLAGTSHGIRASRDCFGEVEFSCWSEWDSHIAGSRLRQIHGRTSRYSVRDIAKVRRFARKYGCEVPTHTYARVVEQYQSDLYMVRDGGYVIARNLCKADAEQVAQSYCHKIVL